MSLFSPSLLLILLFSLVYGAAFHLWRGRGWRDLAIYLATALVGMVLGQVAGKWLGLNILKIGVTYVFEGSLLAWLLMFAMLLLRR